VSAVSRLVISVAALVLADFFGCATSPPASIDGVLAVVDAQIEQLRPILRGYPPNITAAESRAEVERSWHATEAELLSLQRSHPDDPRVLLRLGELYRFGHNLDVPDAGSHCASNLTRLLSIDPSNIDAHLILGFLYTDADPRKWEEGERLLRRAIALSGNTPLPPARRALVIVCYHQAKFPDAVAAADAYLALVPNDSNIQALRQLAVEAAARGATTFEPVGRVRLGE
jgi:tetratricopeptide (TPR) repeat protein